MKPKEKCRFQFSEGSLWIRNRLLLTTVLIQRPAEKTFSQLKQFHSFDTNSQIAAASLTAQTCGKWTIDLKKNSYPVLPWSGKQRSTYSVLADYSCALAKHTCECLQSWGGFLHFQNTDIGFVSEERRMIAGNEQRRSTYPLKAGCEPMRHILS